MLRMNFPHRRAQRRTEAEARQAEHHRLTTQEKLVKVQTRRTVYKGISEKETYRLLDHRNQKQEEG